MSTDPEFTKLVAAGIPSELPPMPPDEPGINHAPARPQVLSDAERELALSNALRYVPEALHRELAPELARELAEDGRIYMRRLRPTYAMRARPISAYPARSRQAAAIMLMITNNLDPQVAQHPHELITYGGNGTVFQNWAQYLLTMQYLSQMTDEQTLILYSGHPLGLFPSGPEAPRVVITNGMVVPNYSSGDDYNRMSALGVTMYGQMTAGSFMYIGSQGIVHGTVITLMNAARRYLGVSAEGNLAGKVFVTSGLGGMSGAQGKAAVISGAVGVLAEINPMAVKRRADQGWVTEVEEDLDKLLARIEQARRQKEAVALAYLPYTGGYYPVGMTLAQANAMMVADPDGFKEAVQDSLRRQVAAIHTVAARGMHFWDYGNAFLLEASRAGAQGITKPDGTFAYPSYVEDIMGPMCFDYGFGPFRWVCTSNSPDDLATTDGIAAEVLRELAAESPDEVQQQLQDNIRWIEEAGRHEMVIGSQARILYAHAEGRIRIARAFNEAIRSGRVTEPVVLGRDHHDVSGTDSPYRETANIYDGSRYCADMAVQNVIGDAFRGASWVSLHNGGGTGWGEALNGGFGLLLDGTDAAERRLTAMLHWDVNNGIARRAWAGNEGAEWSASEAMKTEERLSVTMPEHASESLVKDALSKAFDA